MIMGLKNFNLLTAGISKSEIATVILLSVAIVLFVIFDALLVVLIHKMNKNVKVRSALYAKQNATSDSEVREVTSENYDAESYNFSFSARLNQSNEITQLCYGRVKNELLTYCGVNSTLTWEYESFFVDEKELARISLHENYVVVYFALAQSSECLQGIPFQDLSGVEGYENVPVLIVMDTPQMLANVLSIIKSMCDDNSLTRGEERHVDYREQKRTPEQLLMLGLIK